MSGHLRVQRRRDVQPALRDLQDVYRAHADPAADPAPAPVQREAAASETRREEAPRRRLGHYFGDISILPPGVDPPPARPPGAGPLRTHVTIQAAQPVRQQHPLPMERRDARELLSRRIDAARGGGAPLEPRLQRTLERGLNADLSAVRQPVILRGQGRARSCKTLSDVVGRSQQARPERRRQASKLTPPAYPLSSCNSFMSRCRAERALSPRDGLSSSSSS